MFAVLASNSVANCAMELKNTDVSKSCVKRKSTTSISFVDAFAYSLITK